MNKTDIMVAKLLRNQGLMDQFQHQSVLDYLGQRGGRFHLAVIALGLVPEEKVAEAVSQVSGMPRISLAKLNVDLEALQRLSGEFCARYAVYPCAIRDNGKTLWLAMADPTDVNTRNAARAESGLEIRPLVELPSEIEKHVHLRYADQKGEESPFVVGAIDLSLSPEEEAAEEFKITDLAGKTTVKHTRDVAKAAGPPAPAGDKVAGSRRIDKLIAYQEKAERIMKSVVRLMIDKGLFSADEFRDRLK